MDTLSRLLHDVRPRGAVLDRSFVRPPWGLRFAAGAPLTLVAVLRGEGWIEGDGPGDGPALQVRAGDVAIARGGRPFTVADRPGSPPTVVVHEGNRCTTPDGRAADDPDLGCADAADAAAVLLTAAFPVEGSLCERVLEGLPPVLVTPVQGAARPALDMLAAELTADRPGQQAVLDHLLGLLLVATLRDWLDRPGSGAPAWYRAQADPVVGAALRLIHGDPAHPWTVAELARRAAVSRAALARRFTELVGEPPIGYLACWRTCLAADLLRETDDTVDAIARRVGYANADALGVAFKRTYGVRPTEHRARSRA